MAVKLARQPRGREAMVAWSLRLLTFAVFATFWQLAAGASRNPLIVTFTETVRGLVDLAFVSGDLWAPLLISNQAMVIGYAASVVIAVPWGLAAARYSILDRLSDPYVAVFLAIPIAPLIPIVIVGLGIGLASRVLLVFFFAFIFIAVNTRAGVRQVDATLVEMAKSFGANEREVWRLVVLPGASPAIFAGLRIGLGRAIAGMVIVELLMIASGVGRLLMEYSGRLQGDLLFAVTFAIVLQALILLSIMRVLERRLVPWAHDASA